MVVFEIGFRRCLDADGRAAAELPEFARRPADLVPVLRALLRTRAFDSRLVALQRAGQLGTYASSLGQEAVSVGLASAMRAEDVLLPSFREQGALLWRGVSMRELLLFWGGDERGSDWAGPRADFPISIPVASHAPHAAGVALAFQLRREPRVAVCVLGDGATSKGDFYEALNFAGVWALPAVFVVCNNGWAISVPRARQTAAQTLAQKAIAAGIPGEQVDGNDVIAVRDALERALARARSGGGPALVEALTYRLADHTTADDARRYRDEAEVAAAWQLEPIARLRAWLERAGVWSAADESAFAAELEREIEAAVAAYLATPAPAPESMFDALYAELPRDLEAQRAEVSGSDA
jgi:pyruvate dehydrogenase E1 component alpha subunit